MAFELSFLRSVKFPGKHLGGTHAYGADGRMDASALGSLALSTNHVPSGLSASAPKPETTYRGWRTARSGQLLNRRLVAAVVNCRLRHQFAVAGEQVCPCCVQCCHGFCLKGEAPLWPSNLSNAKNSPGGGL